VIDLIQIQDDLYGILMSAPQLVPVNIVEERAFRLKATLAKDAIWQTTRNGCTGNGLLIEIPQILCDADGVTGPPQQVELSFVSFQNGDAAFTPPAARPGQTTPLAGGGLFAEQIEQYLIDILHLLNLGGSGTLRVSGHFSSPAREFPGVNARRTKLILTPKQTAQTTRVVLPMITVSAGNASITCATPGASVYYTTDGSFPSNPTIALAPANHTAINAGSQLYTAPFAVTAGQVIRAAGYLNGYNLSPIARLQN
jgi:hypothetical protein